MKKRNMVILVVTVALLAVALLSACAQPATPAPAAPTQVPGALKPAAPGPSAAPAVTTGPAPTSAPAPTATAKPRIIRISYSCPKGKGYSTASEWFATEFPKRTNGRYQVEAYGASTLVPITAVLESTSKGVCTIGLTSTAQFAKDFPLSMVTQTPTLGWVPAEGFETVDSLKAGKAAWDEFQALPEVAPEFKDFKFLGNIILPSSQLVMKKKQVRLPADFAGTKIGGGGTVMEIAKANGGAAVPIVTPEIYVNMDKGVIDGSVMSMTMVTDWKIQAIADWFFMVELGSGNMVCLMNKDFWNSMPPADQQLLVSTWNEGMGRTFEFMVNSAVESRKILTDAGKKLTVPTSAENEAWKKSIDPVIAGWKKDAMSVGVSAATCDKILQSWRDIRTKYWNQFKLSGTP